MEASCLVCQEPFDAACDMVAIKCGHVFHSICLTQWRERSSTCPECRTSIDENDIIKLFFKGIFDDSSCEEQSLDELKEKLQEKDEEISAKNKEIEELTASSQKKDEEISAKKKEIEELTALSRDQNKDIELLRASHRDKNIENEELYDSYDKLREEKNKEIEELTASSQQWVEEKNKKIDELTASYQKLLKDKMEYATMLASRNERLMNAEFNYYDLCADNSQMKDELEHLKNVETMLKGSCNDIHRILEEHASSDDARDASRKLAEFCSVIKQQLVENIDHRDQLQKELTELKAKNEELQGNVMQYCRALESRESERLMDTSSHSLSGNVRVETNSTRKCAPKYDIVRSDYQMNPVPLDFSASKKRKMQSVTLNKELPSMPIQLPQRALLNPAYVHPTPADSVARVRYNGLGGNERSMPGNISQLPEFPDLCPSRFSLSTRPENEDVPRTCSICLKVHWQVGGPGSCKKAIQRDILDWMKFP